MFGTPEQNPEFWDSVSATSYLADLSGPLQLHHGTADESVPLEFSIRLAERARAAGGTADLYIYDGDNHNIANYFSTAMARTVEFFDEYLRRGTCWPDGLGCDLHAPIRGRMHAAATARISGCSVLASQQGG
jgi:dipeptidyl aminopeptidase/acylaminoacyl peptidase